MLERTPLAVFLVVSLSMSATATAQTMSVRLLSIAGSTNVMNTPIGREDCDQPIAVKFQVANVPTGRTHIDVWEGQSCADETKRNLSNTDGECRYVKGFSSTGAQQDLDFTTAELFGDRCSTEMTLTFFFFATMGQEHRGAVEANSQASSMLSVDGVAPGAPTLTSGGSGDTEIPIAWTPPSGAGNTIDRYQVYAGTAAAGGCSAAGDGGAGGSDPTREITIDVPGTSSTVTLTGTSLSLAINESTTVAIAAVDKAGNEGPKSNAVCVTRVATEGFCSAHGRCESCSVTTVGRARAQGVLPAAVVLLALGLAAWRRRS